MRSPAAAPERPRAARRHRPRVLPALLALALLAGSCAQGAPTGEDAAAGPEESGDLGHITRPAGRGEVHLVRLVARPDGRAFEPARVQLRPGDVLRFVATSHQAESVAFDTVALDPARLGFLHERGAVRGPLLVRPGQVYDVDFGDAPPGEYPFHSVPHRAAGMRGVALVE
jgi:plastocyanin